MAKRKYKRRKSKKKNPSFKGLCLALWTYIKLLAKAIKYVSVGFWNMFKKVHQFTGWLLSKIPFPKTSNENAESPKTKKSKRNSKSVTESKFQILES